MCASLSLRNPARAHLETCVLRTMCPFVFRKQRNPVASSPSRPSLSVPVAPAPWSWSSLCFLFSSLPTHSCCWNRTIKKGQMIDSRCPKVIMRGQHSHWGSSLYSGWFTWLVHILVDQEESRDQSSAMLLPSKPTPSG